MTLDETMSPPRVLEPASSSELSEMMRARKEPYRIAGGGTRGDLSAVQGTDLRTTRISGISLYEPGALTLVAAAGTPLREIEETLAENRQRLAFEPPDLRDLLGREGISTLGGVVASNASGPRRVAVGACRDFILGVTFVDGTGTIVKNGGRVMKNVTGYDLVKLLTGSRGTLGVLTEIALKVLPEPEAEATIALAAEDARHAVRVMTGAIGTPFDVTGAAYDPESKSVFIRIEGFADSVRYRAQCLSQGFEGASSRLIEDRDESASIWRDIRDARSLAGLDADIWKISVRPTDSPDLITNIAPRRYLLDWSGGLVWIATDPGTDVRSQFRGVSGHASLIRNSSPTTIPRFHPEPAPLQQLSTGIRRKFDPHGILNPGLFA